MKQNVFNPFLNFFSTGLLIILSPTKFFHLFNFIQASWQRTLGYALLYKMLNSVIYTLSFQALFFMPLIDKIKDFMKPYFPLNALPLGPLPSFGMGPESLWASLVVAPFSHIAGVLMGAAGLWGISRLSRSGFGFKETFNLLNAFAPYSLLYALLFGFVVLFSSSLMTFLVLSIFAGFIALVSLFFMVRSFHMGAKVAIHDTLAKDPNALDRFYMVGGVVMLLPFLMMILCLSLLGQFFPV